MPTELGRGAQVVLTGEAQGAARGAVTDTLTGNEDARNAATPLENYGTPSPPDAVRPGETSVFTRRRHIWQRATEEESAALSAALEQADDKMAQTFLASDWIDHSNELWPALLASVVQAVGPERAAVLLAPSPYSEI